MSGYDYTCRLKGSDLTTSYISSEGVICTITQDDVRSYIFITCVLCCKVLTYTYLTNCSVQVKIASSQERVSLQLMWGNGNIEYSLDENSEDDIKCRSPHHTVCHALPLDHSLPW